ncbi:ANTAR domain-containing protein [Streptomyces sp. NPDC055189]
MAGKRRSQRVVEVFADLGSLSLVEEPEGLLILAEAFLDLLPVGEVRITLNKPEGRRTCQAVLADDSAGDGSSSNPCPGFDGPAVVLELRHKDHALGTVELLPPWESPLTAADLRLAQDLADLAVVGLASRRLLEESRNRVRGLQRELDEKVLVEQAKGMLAEFTGRTPGRALALLRAQSMKSRKTLVSLAREIVDASGVQPLRQWPSWALPHQKKGPAPRPVRTSRRRPSA